MRDHDSGCPMCRSKPQMESLEPRLLLSSVVGSPSQQKDGTTDSGGLTPIGLASSDFAQSAVSGVTDAGTPNAAGDVQAQSLDLNFALPGRSGYNQNGTAFTEVRNSPLGTAAAQDIFPGRVTWVHNPAATKNSVAQGGWNYTSGSTYFWQNTYTDYYVIKDMMAKGVMNLTGTTSVTDAWRALINSFWTARGQPRTDGYHTNETFAIKVNLNNDLAFTTADNGKRNTPQVISALLDQLVNVVGIPQDKIYIYDDVDVWSTIYWDYYTPTNHNPGDPQGDGGLYSPRYRFQNVHWMDYGANYSLGTYCSWGHRNLVGRNTTVLTGSRVMQYPFASNGGLGSKIPDYVYNATYMISNAVLSAHSGAGVTLTAKNHIGSIGDSPDTNYNKQIGVHDHNTFTNGADDGGQIHAKMGDSRTMAAFIANQYLGQNTVLFMIDGIYGGWGPAGSTTQPTPWEMPPFNGWFPSSLFLSQDAVAIDSVGLDFLWTESLSSAAYASGRATKNLPTDSYLKYSDDYLHEAAQIGNPPSHSANGYALYDLAGNNDAWLRAMGTSASAGVHEHWDDALHKQYSRNLGKTNGIDLQDVELGTAVVPEITSVKVNGSSALGVGSLDASSTGLTSIAVTFDRNVSLSTAYDIIVQRVTLGGGGEVIGSGVTPSSITNSGGVVTISIPSQANTWLKVTLKGSETVTGSAPYTHLSYGIMDTSGNALLMDGSAKPASAGGSGRGYLYSSADLGGDGVAGGDAVFYVANLTADANADRNVDGLDYQIWQTGYNKPAPTPQTGDFNKDASVDGIDYQLWQTAYNHAIGPLPLTLPIHGDTFAPMGASETVVAPLAQVPGTGSDAPIAAASAELSAAMIASAGTAHTPAITMAPMTWVNAVDRTPTTSGKSDPAPASDGGLDLLGMPALLAPLG